MTVCTKPKLLSATYNQIQAVMKAWTEDNHDLK